MAQVQSMQACLVVVELLQAVKRGVVSAPRLASAISDHLRLYVDAYGADSVRPKHHYMMHLPSALARHGTLIATYTHERKHRVVKRYTRNRMNLTHWELGAMGDITCHQIWELSRPFLLSDSCAIPRQRTMFVLREVFPGFADAAFTMHSTVTIDNSTARNGDVVLYRVRGELGVGELLMTVGINADDTRELWSVVSSWRASSSQSVDPAFANYDVREDAIKVAAADLHSCLTCRFADDRSQCAVYVPLECRLNLKDSHTLVSKTIS